MVSENDRFFVYQQNLVMGYIHLVASVLGAVVAAFRAVSDVYYVTTSSHFDSKYLSFVLIYFEGFMCIFAAIVAWLTGLFIMGVKKHSTCMMFPLMCVIVTCTVILIVAAFFEPLLIIAIVFYSYFIFLSCHLYADYKENPNNVMTLQRNLNNNYNNNYGNNSINSMNSSQQNIINQQQQGGMMVNPGGISNPQSINSGSQQSIPQNQQQVQSAPQLQQQSPPRNSNVNLAQNQQNQQNQPENLLESEKWKRWELRRSFRKFIDGPKQKQETAIN